MFASPFTNDLLYDEPNILMSELLFMLSSTHTSVTTCDSGFGTNSSLKLRCMPFSQVFVFVVCAFSIELTCFYYGRAPDLHFCFYISYLSHHELEASCLITCAVLVLIPSGLD